LERGHGLPGDPDYREFYRDLGYDLDYDYVRPYLHSDGVRRNIGLNITGSLARLRSGKTTVQSRVGYE